MSTNNEANFDYAVDFKRLVSALIRWAWCLILLAGLGAGSAYYYSSQQTPIYKATTTILITRSSLQTHVDLSQTLNLSQLVETYTRMLSLDGFLGIVSRELGYEVAKDNVVVSALPNTQIIQLEVQDVDPARAVLIANTMVKVLERQTETLLSGQYAETEQSLDIQIKDTETQIADLQAKLEQAKNGAFVEQSSRAKASIDATVNAIKLTATELDRLGELDWEKALFRLDKEKARLPEEQALLDQQIAENEKLKEKLATDPKVNTNQKYADGIRAKITAMDEKIADTRQKIVEIRAEIAYLTPLATQQGYISALVEKENLLKTQQALLAAYQGVYASLLSTGEIQQTTREIDDLKRSLDFYQARYLNLLSSREDVKKQKLQNVPPIEPLSPAHAANDPVAPRTLLNTLLGGVAGLILAFILVMLLDMMKETFKSPKGKVAPSKSNRIYLRYKS